MRHMLDLRRKRRIHHNRVERAELRQAEREKVRVVDALDLAAGRLALGLRPERLQHRGRVGVDLDEHHGRAAREALGGERAGAGGRLETRMPPRTPAAVTRRSASAGGVGKSSAHHRLDDFAAPASREDASIARKGAAAASFLSRAERRSAATSLRGTGAPGRAHRRRGRGWRGGRPALRERRRRARRRAIRGRRKSDAVEGRGASGVGAEAARAPLRARLAPPGRQRAPCAGQEQREGGGDVRDVERASAANHGPALAELGRGGGCLRAVRVRHRRGATLVELGEHLHGGPVKLPR